MVFRKADFETQNGGSTTKLAHSAAGLGYVTVSLDKLTQK